MLLEVGHHVPDGRVRVVGGNVHLETVAGGQHRGLLDVRELAELRSPRRLTTKNNDSRTSEVQDGGDVAGYSSCIRYIT